MIIYLWRLKTEKSSLSFKVLKYKFVLVESEIQRGGNLDSPWWREIGRFVTDQVEDETADMDQNEPITQVKDKRVSVRPTKYQDFVIPSLKKGSRK
jgi:hypothetical protein